MKNKKSKFKIVIFLLCFLLLNTKNNNLLIYGKEGMIEESVKKKISDIVQEDMNGKISKYTIVEYDIEKLYPVVSIDYFINDYISGMTFSDIIKKNQSINEKENPYTYWLLPYVNNEKQNCLATFFSDSKEVGLVTRTINTQISYDMKLYKGKFDEINLKEVKKIVYLNLELYRIRAIYILMYNENEYIIPYITDEFEKCCKLECEKAYDIEKFIVTMYNCYNEPLKGRNSKDLDFENSVIETRKKILNYKSIEQIKEVNWLKTYGIVICVVLCVIGFVVYKITRKKIKSSV